MEGNFFQWFPPIVSNIIFALLLLSGFPLGLGFAICVQKSTDTKTAARLGTWVTLLTILLVNVWKEQKGAIFFIIFLALPVYWVTKLVIEAILASIELKRNPSSFENKETKKEDVASSFFRPQAIFLFPLILAEEFVKMLGPKLDPNVNDAPNANGLKPVPWYLVMGIVILPFIFAWFTLRRCYSNGARLWAFGWMIAFCTVQWLYIVHYR